MNSFIPRLELRDQNSAIMNFMSPVLAIILTLATSAIIFSIMGFNPIQTLYVFFISPISSLSGLSELLVKAIPLALIGTGLAFCFKNKIYNIGAEGQLTMGAIFGGGVAIYFYDSNAYWLLTMILIAGSIGGVLWALIPAYLKIKFNTNEILTSLMLVYISLYILDYLVVGPWKDPLGFSYPKSRPFSEAGRLPVIFDGYRVHAGLYVMLTLVFLSWFIFSKTLIGFKLKVSGYSSMASRFAGFNQNYLIFLGFGWNFLFISGTSLLVLTYKEEEKFRAQGLNDFIVYSVHALGSLSAGILIVLTNWKIMNLICIPLIIVIILITLRADLLSKK